MDQTKLIQALLSILMVHSPLIVIYLLGIGFALGTWDRHRLASALTLIGSGVLLLHVITLGTITAVLPSILHDRGWSNADIADIFPTINMLRSMISSIGVGFLLVAIFARRPTQFAEG